MNEIAIGQQSSWLVLSGPTAESPFKSVGLSSHHDCSDRIEDRIKLFLEGSPAEISTGLADLEVIVDRAGRYIDGVFPHQQLLRIQPEESGEYFYTPIQDIWLDIAPEGERSHYHGKLIVFMHFTRPNHFDGDQVELPLSIDDQEAQTGGVEILNHFDVHPGHSNSVLVYPESVSGALPAPLRMELTSTYPTDNLKDIFVGILSNSEFVDEEILHCYASDFTGGDLYTNGSAIQGYYLKASWSETDWKLLCAAYLDNVQVASLRGRYFRPILHLYNPLGYQDLRLQLYLQAGTFVLYEGEPVWIDPNYGYVVFPPIQIPPHQLLYEVSTQTLNLVLYGQHDSAASSEIAFDDLILLPVDRGSIFLAYHTLIQDSVLIDDNFKGQTITRYLNNSFEISTHLKQGDDLMIQPGQYNRIIFIMTNSADQIDMLRTASVRLYYRKRIRFL